MNLFEYWKVTPKQVRNEMTMRFRLKVFMLLGCKKNV